MIKVWTDGNGFGFYAYVTENRQGTIGRLEHTFKKRGRNALCAEAQALLTALENVRSDDVRIHVDSQAVLGLVARPDLLKKTKHQLVRPTIEAILEHLTDRKVEVRMNASGSKTVPVVASILSTFTDGKVELRWVRGRDNMAHDLLTPYRNVGRRWPTAHAGKTWVMPTWVRVSTRTP
jgi:ribonuclease HI